MKYVFHGYMKDGKLQCSGLDRWLAEAGRESVTIVASDTRPKRSSQANRYYWGVVLDLIYLALRESGWEINKEGTHELLRVRFLSVDKPIGDEGGFLTRVKSTTELDSTEFVAYIERCKQFAAEYLNVVIPEPNDQLTIPI